MRIEVRMAAVMGLLMCVATPGHASTLGIHRGLRRMVGFTIISSDSVDKVIETRDGDKYVKLLSGAVFKMELLLLEPLAASDVIVFAKALPESIAKQYPSLPAHLKYQYRLLIDDEFYDATAVP